VAALGLYDVMLGAEGASVVVVATAERQTGLVFGAARLVELHPELEQPGDCTSTRTGWSCRPAARSRCPPVPGDADLYRTRGGWQSVPKGVKPEDVGKHAISR
jgi:hypothetical protein